MTNSLKHTFKRTLAILDGTPTGTRGQSLMELTLTFPIFMILLLGLVEVGWLANNYLTLVDVSREAGRAGSIRDPLQWQPGTELNYERMDCDVNAGYYNKFPNENITVRTDVISDLPGYSNGVEGDFAFYDSVACAVLVNMAPLEFNDDVDDIVVSVISYVVIEESGTRSISVVGRYPGQSNECGDEARDPFAPPWLAAGDRDSRFDAGADNRRGYMFRGNHEVSDSPGCLGSEFSLTDIQDLLNKSLLSDDPSLPPITQQELEGLPNNSIVIVEIFWESEQLLHLPFFTWIGNPVPIHVYSFFPVTASEPTATPAP